MDTEREPKLSEVSSESAATPKHKEGWMSASAIAKTLESGIGDRVVFSPSLREGVPDKKEKFQATVSTYAIKFIADRYLHLDPSHSEVQKNKTQVKEQYSPELVKKIIEEMKAVGGPPGGYTSEFSVSRTLGVSRRELEEKIKYLVRGEDDIVVARQFNKVWLYFSPSFVKRIEV